LIAVVTDEDRAVSDELDVTVYGWNDALACLAGGGLLEIADFDIG